MGQGGVRLTWTFTPVEFWQPSSRFNSCRRFPPQSACRAHSPEPCRGAQPPPAPPSFLPHQNITARPSLGTTRSPCGPCCAWAEERGGRGRGLGGAGSLRYPAPAASRARASGYPVERGKEVAPPDSTSL